MKLQYTFAVVLLLTASSGLAHLERKWTWRVCSFIQSQDENVVVEDCIKEVQPAYTTCEEQFSDLPEILECAAHVLHKKYEFIGLHSMTSEQRIEWVGTACRLHGSDLGLTEPACLAGLGAIVGACASACHDDHEMFKCVFSSLDDSNQGVKSDATSEAEKYSPSEEEGSEDHHDGDQHHDGHKIAEHICDFVATQDTSVEMPTCVLFLMKEYMKCHSAFPNDHHKMGECIMEALHKKYKFKSLLKMSPAEREVWVGATCERHADDFGLSQEECVAQLGTILSRCIEDSTNDRELHRCMVRAIDTHHEEPTQGEAATTGDEAVSAVPPDRKPVDEESEAGHHHGHHREHHHGHHEHGHHHGHHGEHHGHHGEHHEIDAEVNPELEGADDGVDPERRSVQQILKEVKVNRARRIVDAPPARQSAAVKPQVVPVLLK